MRECLLLYVLFRSSFKVNWRKQMNKEIIFLLFLQYGHLSSFSLVWTPDCSWFLCSFAEQKRLKKTDIPLLHRLLQGPSSKNARIFLMDKDAEEISRDVWIPSPWICLYFLLTQHLSHKCYTFFLVFFFFSFSGGSVH